MLQDDPGALEPIQPLLELLALRGREFQRDRNEQLLGSVRRVTEFLIIIFIVDPLMCGVLIDQIQPVLILSDQVGAMVLAD